MVGLVPFSRYHRRMAGRVSLLGVPIDTLSADEVLRTLRGFLEGESGRHVLTPNSEMLAASVRSEVFRQVLQHSALNLPDSAGLLLMAHFTRQRIPERVTGADTVQALCAVLPPEHPVFLLGADEGIAERAADALMRRNLSLVIAGTHGGSPAVFEEADICARIRASGAHVLFVAYGAPRQDLWIARNLPRLPQVRLAMGVGGTFDFLAGEKKRAPLWMRRAGLEWLWRLLLEPRRGGRIFTAVGVFPRMVMWYGKDEPRR